MKFEISFDQLLRWRLVQAQAEAPPAPRAAQLLILARPWWETWPERFRSLADRLNRVQVAYGHAMAEPGHSRGGHRVPVLVIHGAEELEASVSVLYLSVREGRLRFRFQLGRDANVSVYEVTAVSEPGAAALFSSAASRSMDGEYRLDCELAPGLAESWGRLRVTDRMPFRLILRAEPEGG